MATLLMQVPEVRWDECRLTVVFQIPVLFHNLICWVTLFGYFLLQSPLLFKIIFTKARIQMSYSVGERYKPE